MKGIFPGITQQRVQNYLHQYGKELDEKCIQMYEQRQVVPCRAGVTILTVLLTCFMMAQSLFCINLYRYMRWLRLSQSDNQAFLSATVWAEMRKSVSYKVDISVDQFGVVVEAQCECGAGQGPTAHCKHVACTLHAAQQFASSGQVPLCEPVTTQVNFPHAILAMLNMQVMDHVSYCACWKPV